jgi:hypothetical protein
MADTSPLAQDFPFPVLHSIKVIFTDSLTLGNIFLDDNEIDEFG